MIDAGGPAGLGRLDGPSIGETLGPPARFMDIAVEVCPRELADQPDEVKRSFFGGVGELIGV